MTYRLDLQYKAGTRDKWIMHDWWKNFILAQDFSVLRTINERVMDHNARYVDYKKGANHLLFETEDDATMFLLRWS